MTLKSGTNDFHGQAWDFVKYGAWNANNTLNNARMLPKPPQQHNQYGVTATGLIIRSKTFWMFTWEGLRQPSAVPADRQRAPSAAERNGDFSLSFTDQRTPL